VESDFQERMPLVAMRSASIVPAYRRFKTSAFAYDDTSPRESHFTVGKYAAANTTAGSTQMAMSAFTVLYGVRDVSRELVSTIT
jgi:hypothetical protein